MRSCEEIRRKIDELAAGQATEIPAFAQGHLAECRVCTRALAAARLTRGLLAAAAEGSEPPVEFSDQVLAALPRAPVVPARADTDLWRLAWGLVPVFTATTIALLILYQVSAIPAPVGLVPTEGMSASERLVLEASPLEPDLVLAAVMEGGQR